MCFSFAVKAEESNTGYSISDFTMHRVTPVKTEKTSSKSEIPKLLPKLRTVILAEEKTKKTSLSNKSENKTEEKIIVSEIKIKTENHNSEKKASLPEISSPLKTTAPKNNTDKTEKAATTEEQLKIDKINEQNHYLTGDGSKTPELKDSGNAFIKAVASLSIVILLIFIFAWVYARVKGINPTAILTGKFSERDLNKFNVISSSTLGQGKDIHLVEINGKQLVIGSTANNINLLTEIAPEEIEKLKEKKQKLKKEKSAEHIELPEEDEMNFEPIEVDLDSENSENDDGFLSSDYYASQYSDVYKEYIEPTHPNDDKKN